MERSNPATGSGILVDAHVHVFDAGTPLTVETWEHRTHPAPVEALMAEMQAWGITHATLATAGAYGGDNDVFERTMTGWKTLRATASLPLDASPVRIETMTARGFVGTRLHRHKLLDAPDLGDADHCRFFGRLADAGWHVHLTEHPERMADTIAALERSGVLVVVDHLGLIDRAEGVDHPGFTAILDAVGRGTTWVKLSGLFRFEHCAAAEAQASAIIKAAGDARVMWASDWPFVGYRNSMTYDEAVSVLDRFVPAGCRARIAGETAFDLCHR